MKKLTIVVLATICSCVVAGEIAEIYFKVDRANPDSLLKDRVVNDSEVTFTNHGISQIGIERSGCFGACPIYTFVARSDGTFRYKGEKYVERQGDFTGSIPTWQFNRLAQFIKESGFMELKSTYTRDDVIDHSTTLTMVSMNGKPKIVSNYADCGPSKLWAVEQLVDDLLAKAKWDKSTKP